MLQEELAESVRIAMDSPATTDEEEEEKEEEEKDNFLDLSMKLTKNVQRFGQSLSTVIRMQGVLKAKNAFLKGSTKRRGAADKENIDELVQNEWCKISTNPMSLTIADINFSDVKDVLEVLEEEDAKVKDYNKRTNDTCPPPPPPKAPPPPPGAPPPPPGALPHPPPGAPPPPFLAFNNTLTVAHKTKTGLSPDTPDGVTKKLKPVHVKPARAVSGTVWTDLPHVHHEMADLQDLFDDSTGSISPFKNVKKSFRKRNALTAKECSDILIITRRFPK